MGSIELNCTRVSFDKTGPIRADYLQEAIRLAKTHHGGNWLVESEEDIPASTEHMAQLRINLMRPDANATPHG